MCATEQLQKTNPLGADVLSSRKKFGQTPGGGGGSNARRLKKVNSLAIVPSSLFEVRNCDGASPLALAKFLY